MIVVLDDHGFIIMGWEVEGGLSKRSMEVKKEIMGDVWRKLSKETRGFLRMRFTRHGIC
jgi:hypothetical protein